VTAHERQSLPTRVPRGDDAHARSRGTAGDESGAVRKACDRIEESAHDAPSVEIVVTRTPLYLIVEKTREAAEHVTEHLEDQQSA